MKGKKELGLASAKVDPDVQLMLRVRDDDAVAFEELILSFQARLLRLLRHSVGSEAIAEELVQDVFLRVWRARKSYQPKAKFSTWLFHIAHNVANNAIRDRRRRGREVQVHDKPGQPSGVFSLEQMAMASTGSMPARKFDKNERAEMVKMAVEALNERQRMALMLSRFEGLSYKEIADTMDLSLQAVKSLLSRARMNLKVLLEPYLDQGQLPGADSEDESLANEAHRAAPSESNVGRSTQRQSSVTQLDHDTTDCPKPDCPKPDQE